MNTRGMQLVLGIPTPEARLFPVGHRILRGVRQLDALFGEDEWRARIDGSILHMRTNCVVMQLFGDYGAGCCEMGLNPHSAEPYLHGFNIVDPTSLEAAREFAALTAGWNIARETKNTEQIFHLRLAA